MSEFRLVSIEDHTLFHTQALRQTFTQFNMSVTLHAQPVCQEFHAVWHHALFYAQDFVYGITTYRFTCGSKPTAVSWATWRQALVFVRECMLCLQMRVTAVNQKLDGLCLWSIHQNVIPINIVVQDVTLWRMGILWFVISLNVSRVLMGLHYNARVQVFGSHELLSVCQRCPAVVSYTTAPSRVRSQEPLVRERDSLWRSY